MKKLSLLLILSFLFISINAQFFEGKIVYKIKLKNSTITKNILFKGNRCRIETSFANIKFPKYSVIINNELYFIDKNMRIILKDTSSNNTFNDNFIKLNKKEVLLGYKCSVYKNSIENTNNKNLIFITVANSLETDIKIPSIAVKGNIILKTIQKNSDYQYTMEVVKIIPMRLDKNLFKLPEYPIREVSMAAMVGQVILESK